MGAPHWQGAPPPTAPSPAPSSRGSGGRWAAAAAALVVGAGIGVGAGWFLLDDAEAAASVTAEADAAHACDIAERYPDGIDMTSTGAMDEDPTIRLLGAMHELTRSAATEDSSYEVLFESAGVVRQAFVSYNLDAMDPALDDLRAQCTDLGLGGNQ